MEYSDIGDGPSVVLVHGMPGSGRDFKYLVPVLEDHRVVTVDLPGFGKSPMGTTGFAIHDRSEVLVQLLDELDLHEVVLVGHSMGGPVVLEASRSPRVKAVVLAASVGLTRHRPLRVPGVLRVGALVDLPGVSRMLLPLFRDAFRRSGFRNVPDGEILQTLRVLSKFAFDRHRHNIASCEVPSTVIWCTDDPVIEPSIHGALAEALHATAIELPKGGHNPQARCVDVVRSAIQEHFRT